MTIQVPYLSEEAIERDAEALLSEFVEKEGFNQLLDSADVANRFDLAIMSTKGLSVTAARTLVEDLTAKGVTVGMLHDFDKAGFSIVHTLRNDTRRYRLSHIFDHWLPGTGSNRRPSG